MSIFDEARVAAAEASREELEFGSAVLLDCLDAAVEVIREAIDMLGHEDANALMSSPAYLKLIQTRTSLSTCNPA